MTLKYITLTILSLISFNQMFSAELALDLVRQQIQRHALERQHKGLPPERIEQVIQKPDGSIEIHHAHAETLGKAMHIVGPVYQRYPTSPHVVTEVVQFSPEGKYLSHKSQRSYRLKPADQLFFEGKALEKQQKEFEEKCRHQAMADRFYQQRSMDPRFGAPRADRRRSGPARSYEPRMVAAAAPGFLPPRPAPRRPLFRRR